MANIDSVYQDVKLVVDIGNNRAIEIPLRGKLIILPSSSYTGGAQATAYGSGGGRGGGGDGSDDEELLIRDKRGWLMTVAALFVQMSFQALLQPPGWISNNDWYGMLHPSRRGSRSSAAAMAAAPWPSGDSNFGQARRVMWYLIVNTFTFATALSLMVTLLTKRSSNKYYVEDVTVMMVFLAFSTTVTYVLANPDLDLVKYLCVIIAGYAGYTFGLYFNYIPSFTTMRRQITGLVRRITSKAISIYRGI